MKICANLHFIGNSFFSLSLRKLILYILIYIYLNNYLYKFYHRYKKKV